MQINVRPAKLNDAETVTEFNLLLALESEGKALDRDLLAAGVAAGIADANKIRYFIAERDGSPGGQMAITLEWSDWRNGWFWWFQSVFVRPEARQQGVFRSLFDHVQHAAQDDPDVIGLRLYVEETNLAAQETYSRLGMSNTGYFVLEKYPLDS